MDSVATFPSKGRLKSASDGKLIFLPSNTNYELHLKSDDPNFAGTADAALQGTITLTARKLWTVPSGGTFIAPIFGEPRTIQGRVKWLDETTLVLQAGTNIVVKIPDKQSAIDLANGGIEIGALVNVTAMPGASFSPIA